MTFRNKFEAYKNNPKARIGVTFFVAAVVSFSILADQNDWWFAWTGQSNTDVTLPCPSLETGCSFAIGDKSYQIKSDSPLEVGKPFTLELSGDIVSARAVWRMTEMDMGPNNYNLIRNAAGAWHATVILPPCPHGSKEWQLHMEVNGRAADINTQVR